MPCYQYHCSLCDSSFEDFRKVASKTYKHPQTCPSCGKRKGFSQVLGLPIGIHGGEPTCVGQVAERNMKGVSQERHEQLLNAGRDDTWTGVVPEGATVMPTKPKAPIPWWRNGQVAGLKKMEKPLDLSKIKDVTKYIETGETK